MSREQIFPEIRRAAEEGARLRAEAEADAKKRRNELIEEARRIDEHEQRRLLAQAWKRAPHRSAEGRARGLEGAAGAGRRQLPTVRETRAYAERLKELAHEAAEILSAAPRGALIVVDPRELGLGVRPDALPGVERDRA